ncbi:hypothetical protein AGDE_12047 [Angomonas deanei]|nr:hypothetical protein AGDE_12047 [Angomonas deanei]|eukprot:EPY25047.1 hypothetical protein AGDE_12047 [Angomonas deanei]
MNRSQSKSRSKKLATPPPPPPGSDVVAATFANADLRTTKAALEDYYKKCLDLDKENQMLRGEMAQQSEDSAQVLRHLQQRLEEALGEKLLCASQLEQERGHHAEELQLVKSKYDRMMEERDQQLSQYSDMVNKLQDDLRQASRYVQQRQEHALELKQLQDRLESMVVEQDKQMTALRFQTMDRKMKLVALEKTMQEEFEAKVKAESERLLQEQHNNLIEHAQQLEEEKYMLGKDVEGLVQLADVMEKEGSALRRKMDLHRRAYDETLRLTATRNRQSREAELRVQQLEARVRELTAREKTVKDDVARQYLTQIEDLEKQLKSTQNALQEHRQQLKQTRQLASHIVEQRTDLEKFFHTALEDCKRYRQSLLQTSGGKMGGSARGSPIPQGSSLPPVRTSHSPNLKGTDHNATHRSTLETDGVPPNPSGDGAYFGDLSWEDKEKVIKSLLFFINSTYYKNGAK